MLPPDLHSHSILSFDGHDTVARNAARAAELGLAGLAVTEHIEFDPRSNAHGWFDYGKIRQAVEAARAERPGLKIWLGVEVGWDPRHEGEIRAFLAAHDFDFVLGSLHAVDGLDVGPQLFAGRTFEEAARAYALAAAEAVKTGLFDVLGHADLPKRYGLGHYRQGWNAEASRAEMETLFSALLETGTLLEVNTSGLRQAPKETLPGPQALAWYKALGGRRVALGGDAHHAAHVGLGFADTVAALAALGLEAVGDPHAGPR